MKLLGLIGGTSWVSTVEYYRQLNQIVARERGGDASAKLLMYSVDFSEIRPIAFRYDWDGLLEVIGGIAQKLEQGGAEALILGANTMHVIAERLQERLRIPIIHIADAVSAEIKRAGLDTVALLGTRFTMELDFLKDRYAKNGVRCVIPTDAERDYIHQTIFDELTHDIFTPETKAGYVRILDRMYADGIHGAALACTEIPMLVKQSDTRMKLFDTTAIHAEAAVRVALGKEAGATA